MPTSQDSKRIVIAGASSLLGGELKTLLEESSFSDWDFRLVDEELAAGTLTEAGGEPAVIQLVEEDTFEKARLIFFTGSQKFTRANLDLAMRNPGKILDLSGALAGHAETTAWFSGMEKLQQPQPSGRRLFFIPSAAGEAIAQLSLALQAWDCGPTMVVCLQSVSEAGKAGIEELETQTGQLLSFQSVGKALFDSQIAFNLLDRYGPASLHRLEDAADRIRREVACCLGASRLLPSVQVIHAPVFYGMVFTAFAELGSTANAESLGERCKKAGFAVSDAEDAPSNVSAAGKTFMQLAPPRADPARPGGWWFWGAADNIRLPAWNAVKLAEKLVA